MTKHVLSRITRTPSHNIVTWTLWNLSLSFSIIRVSPKRVISTPPPENIEVLRNIYPTQPSYHHTCRSTHGLGAYCNAVHLLTMACKSLHISYIRGTHVEGNPWDRHLELKSSFNCFLATCTITRNPVWIDSWSSQW